MGSFREGPIWIVVVFFGIVIACACALVDSAGGQAMTGSETKTVRRVALVGASVGGAWDFPGLPARAGVSGYELEYVARYRFDKSEEIAALLAREERRPDAVIIKECAAFFPGDTEKHRNLVRRWVAECRAAGVAPVLATVVPVTRTYPLRMFVLELLHGRLRFPKETQRAILAYNDWIREYARTEGLPLLDLETAVRSSDANRHLKESYARKDGLHLNAKAYRELDRIAVPALERIPYQR
jgi:hypothetical protein